MDFHGKCLVTPNEFGSFSSIPMLSSSVVEFMATPQKTIFSCLFQKDVALWISFGQKDETMKEIWAISYICLWKEQMCLFLSIFPYFLAIIKMWWCDVLGQHRKKSWILATWMELHIHTWFLRTLWSKLLYQCRLNVKEIKTT